MPIIESVLMAVKSASKLQSFVKSEEFASVLADIELDAAARAFSKLSGTIDVRSQLWNAINHLETAVSATLHSINKEFEGWTASPDMLFDVRPNKLRLYQCLLAVCYAALGETALCQQALDVAKRTHEQRPVKKESSWWGEASLWVRAPILINSLFWVALPTAVVKRLADPQSFKKYVVSDEQLVTLKSDLNTLFDRGTG